MTRSTRIEFAVSTSEGGEVRRLALRGMVEMIRISLEFDNGRGKVTKHVVDLPIEFLDPDDIRVQFTDPPPSTQEMRKRGERLVQLAKELEGAEPQLPNPTPGDSS